MAKNGIFRLFKEPKIGPFLEDFGSENTSIRAREESRKQKGGAKNSHSLPNKGEGRRQEENEKDEREATRERGEDGKNPPPDPP